MTGDTVIVRVRPGEVRIALKDPKDRLKDFALYRTQSGPRDAQAGEVYLGRVKKVAPAMQAAFVDIGQEREGFLGLSDARPQQMGGAGQLRERISDYVREGETVLVQVIAEARDDKGAKLSRRLSITGALCVLTPGDPGVRVSKRITGDAERNRLRADVMGLLGKGDGCVVRSSAEGVTDTAMRADIQMVRARWDDLQARAAAAKPPTRLVGEDVPGVQYLAEIGVQGITQIVVDDATQENAIVQALTALGVTLSGGINRHSASTDVFAALGVADEVEALLNPVVRLKSGGSLIIEETAALTAIDVNSGGAGAGGGRGQDLALSVNLEAVEEAARQIRLRNLGGLIVIDLLSLREEASRGRVVNAMKAALASDPQGPYVLGTTKAGLLEVTRPRRRAPLSQLLLGPCFACGATRGPSDLAVGLKALEAVLAEVWAQPALIPALRAPSAVIRALKVDAPDALGDIDAKLGHALDLEIDDTLAPQTFAIEPAKR